MNLVWNVYAQVYDSLVTDIEDDVDRKIISVSNCLDGAIAFDCGCGTGDLAHRLSISGANVVAMDSSAAMLKKAKGKYATDTHITWAEGNFIDLLSRKPAGIADLVVSKKSLYSVDTDTFCRSAEATLAPRGRVVVVLPNEEFRAYLFPNGAFSFRHLLKYGIGKVGETLGAVGYRIPRQEELLDTMATHFRDVESHQINHGTYTMSTGTKR